MGDIRESEPYAMGAKPMDDRKTAEKRANETAREAAARVQESSSKAAEGFREYQLKVLSATQANIDAIFEYAQEAVQAQSVSELVELSTTHSRRQLEMMGEQAREIASAAQKLATESARPLTSGFGSQFSRMS
jgi:hypothetical protein